MRLVGIILLSLCPIAGSFYMGIKEQKKLLDLSYIARLLHHLQQEICLRKTKLPLCFEQFEKDGHTECTMCFALREFEKGLSMLSLQAETKKNLNIFFRELGNGDVTQELARFEKINAQIGDELALLEKNIPEKIRVMRTLGICTGGIILLLLL